MNEIGATVKFLTVYNCGFNFSFVVSPKKIMNMFGFQTKTTILITNETTENVNASNHTQTHTNPKKKNNSKK